ncbi:MULTISPECIES: phosphate/phosphite/phosphonate ABC transporter substrate-binding protein [Paenibacillus]|uniref:Phosphonate transport system substrate-binding protein n=1 Tax=Paenibacillus pabuli TaxID=1472 RepID=A0A855Y4L0_9BACL|nr:MULTISPECIES: phosphate/phosphite/phosphonate ABC transporter substrate-binding protein [Paenibacillus]PWW34377.1 phosphonate transport system substrate-binding protein [Paenibacillus pabuli]PXW00798.1 phosphonate transport system substrate-binding protein [Paenibacillus taichungensis]RAI98254.1 phosphonate transport system substrate-binding protein [Paenibacillus pabuli]
MLETNKRKGHLGLIFSLVLMLVILSGCGTTANSSEGEAGMPEVIRIGIMPSEEGEMNRSQEQLAKDITEATGIPAEIFVAEDYNMVIEALRAGKIEIGLIGPFGYIIATERANAKLLVRSESDQQSNTVILVRNDSPYQSVKDLKGKDFLFADPASTSGNLYPRATLMKELGLSNKELDSFFGSVAFSGGHDKSLLALANGSTDAIGTSSLMLPMMAESGLVKEEDFRVIAESEPIVGGAPLLYRQDLPEELVKQLRELMLEYHTKNPSFLESVGAARFVEGSDSDFDPIRQVAKDLDMSPEELLRK